MIEFIKLSFAYKDMEKASLRELHLNIPKGQCVLLCGASGCGKTTVTRLVNGLIPHFFEGKLSGKVTVKGMNVAETEISTLSDSVGTVFQNPRTQFFNTDTDSEIVFGLENRMLDTEELKQQLERVVKDLHIEKLKGCSIFELSGGEKQKIAFASVYATNPDIFVLDEPSSNLDFHSVLELKKLIEKIKRQGKTIIIAEHRLWYLTDIADRVILMQDGQVFKDMNIQDFCRLPVEQIQNMGLRCRNLSEIKTNINGKKNSEHSLELKDIHVKYGEKSILQNRNAATNRIRQRVWLAQTRADCWNRNRFYASFMQSAREYAGVHQWGYKPKNIPARPYLGLSSDDISDLTELAEIFLKRRMQ